MTFLGMFKKTKQTAKSGKFSDFFLHAPEQEKEEVLREAARRANEQQREILNKSTLREANT